MLLFFSDGRVFFLFFLPLFSPFPFPFVLPFFSEGGNGEPEKDWCSDLFLFHVVQRFIPEIEGGATGRKPAIHIAL